MGHSISKAIELSKSKGGTHFSINDANKKGTQSKEELDKILHHILKELPNLNRITVTTCHLHVLPCIELGKITSLVTLSLEDNMLTSLTDGFRSLTNLKELYLTKNQFTKLPKELAHLISLELLSINQNYLGT